VEPDQRTAVLMIIRPSTLTPAECSRVLPDNLNQGLIANAVHARLTTCVLTREIKTAYNPPLTCVYSPLPGVRLWVGGALRG
jgi:hypothetical protein